MNLKLTLSILAIAIANTISTKAQCNCQTFNKDGNVINQCPPTPVAGDNSLQVGMGVGELNHHTEYLALTIRFRYSAEKFTGNLMLVLANGKMITLTMLNSGLEYLGNSEICQATYLLTSNSKALLKTASVKFVRFNLEDGLRHQLPVQMNSHILISQLKCL